MESSPSNPSVPEGTLVRNRFIRGRNVLMAVADFGNLFVDYYLHLKDRRIKVDPEAADLFKAFLAGFTLHAASHPRNEVLAWTILFQDPPLNVFLTGDTELSTVTGRTFTEGLAKEDSNMFYQELVVRGKPLHRSIVPFEGNDPKGTIEFYYAQSEQRPGRFFHLGEDRYTLLTAHPDWDEAWLRNIDRNAVLKLEETESVSDIEKRQFRWHCGCSYGRILEILANPAKSDPDGLFGDSETVQVNCPRCAARYTVSREAMEAHLAEH